MISCFKVVIEVALHFDLSFLGFKFATTSHVQQDLKSRCVLPLMEFSKSLFQLLTRKALCSYINVHISGKSH